MYFAEVHGFLSLLFYFHQCTTLRRRDVTPPPPGLRVDVFITTYNEELDLLRQTIRGRGGHALPPPRRSCSTMAVAPTCVPLAEELGAHYITRHDRTHAKAGNWNNAFKQTDADFIATFDADHVPRPAFLERTLGFFRDPEGRLRPGAAAVPQPRLGAAPRQLADAPDVRRAGRVLQPGHAGEGPHQLRVLLRHRRRPAPRRPRAARRHRHRHDHRGPAHLDRAAQRGVEVGLLERNARDRAGADGPAVLRDAAAALGGGQPEDGSPTSTRSPARARR